MVTTTLLEGKVILHIFNFTRLKLGYFTAQKLQVKNGFFVVFFLNTAEKKVKVTISNT